MPKYSLPSLKCIIGAVHTEEDVLEYLIANGLICNRLDAICGKVNSKKTSNGQTIQLEPCDGRLAYPTMRRGKYYWRCTTNGCRCRQSIFSGTLLDNFNESAADMVMAVYLSMSFVDQQTICCMSRLNRRTVQKIQETIRTVKAIDRGTWDEETLKIGGFFDLDEKLDEDESSGSKVHNSDDSDDEDEGPLVRPSKKPKTTEQVIAGTEYPHLLGRKVGGCVAPAVPGMIRKYNFMEEAKAKLDDAKAKKKKSRCGSSSSSSSSSSDNNMMRADGKSSSRTAGSSEESVHDADDDDEPSIEEYRFFRESGCTNVDDNTADAKSSEEWSVPQRVGGIGAAPSNSLIWLDYEIPEYASTSAPDDAEGVNKSQYRMKEAQIDESLFGKQKYHKGHPVKGTWVLGVCEEGQNADRRKLRLEVCANRNQSTLTEFIVKYVRPATWLAHDYWRGYADGTQGTTDILASKGIRGMAVNHDKTFKEWCAKHRKWVNTNTIEGNWNAVIAKVPKRHYRYDLLTPHLREIEWDRQFVDDLWTAWWKAAQGVTKSMTDAWKQELADITARNPHLHPEPHKLLKQYPRGFNTRTGDAYTHKRLTKERFHYAYCSTANPNYHGCRKCDFHWGQYGELEMEARKACFEDEDAAKKSNKTNDIDVKVPIKAGRSRLSVVLEKLEHMENQKMIEKKKESVKVAENALNKAMENCFAGYNDDSSSDVVQGDKSNGEVKSDDEDDSDKEGEENG